MSISRLMLLFVHPPVLGRSRASHGSVRSFEDLSTRAVLSGYLTSLTSRLIGCHYDDVTKTVFFVGYQISSAQGVGQSGIIVSINLDTGATSSFKFDVDNRYHTVFYSSPYCLVWGGTGTGGSGRAIKLNLEDGTAYRWVPSNAKEVGRFFRGANGQIVLAYVENSGGSAAVIMCNYDPTTDVATEGVKINGIGSSGQIDQNQFFCDGQNTYISSSGSSYRQIVKLSPDNTVLWAKEVSNTASLQMNAGTICADDDHVYISYRSGVVVLDANTGSLVLDARFNGLGASHQLALTSSKLIVASDHGLVVKLAKGTLELPKDSDTIGLSRSTEGASVSISALTGVSVVAQTVTPSFFFNNTVRVHEWLRGWTHK